ncbi:MAG TPA: serine/threonine-protein kinase [Gemmataceae bacterium]|nr:serine/threonine-protein kinase [Gemmataceae bacterium]
MSDDLTPVMGETERRHSQQLSVQTLRPPLRVPGYEQEKFLGRGAFGEVWVATDSNSGRRVAIKYYHRRGGLDWSLLSREVEKLRHLFGDRSVVQLLAVGWDSDPPYYVMEYMEHGSLEGRLLSGPITVGEAVGLVRDVAVGLVHAHGKGILHCDLKPANIMLDQDGKPRLADFGQSRLTHEHSPALGTLFYMAPEQADLKAVPDARWDVYALGALLYRMLTGDPPHRTAAGAAEVLKPGRLEERLERYRSFLRQVPRASGHRSVPGVDRTLADIVDRCLAVNPAQRYPNVQAVLSALDARSLRRARRPLLVLGALGPVLVMLIMALIAGWLFRATVATAQREVIDRALESDHFAARSVARRFALQVEKRWGILEQEALDANLRRRLAQGADLEQDPKACAELAQWINERRAFWAERFAPDAQASLWAVYDRHGYQRACSPTDDRFLHKYFGYRDYFHGLGFNLPKGQSPPRPITRPHRSMVYRRKGNNAWTVAFSVPVPGPGPQDSEPVGVLVMTTDLGGSTRYEWTRKQFAVLIDTRPDESGERGLIVEHPYLNQLSAGAAAGPG